MDERTLCFLLRGDPPQVLLGLKKAGFGVGKYVGFGGKLEAGETASQAAIRELEEEAGVRIETRDLQEMGHLTFLFPARPSWSMVTHVFVTVAWRGDPVESEEIRPAWFDAGQLPFARMWQDAPHWLPDVLAGRPVRMRFVYAADNETVQEMQREEWRGDGEGI